MRLFLGSLAAALILTSAPGTVEKPHSAAAPLSGTPVLEVLFPPTSPDQRNYEEVQDHLLNKNSPAFALISGAVIRIDWSDFDLGDPKSGTHTKYDFTIIDNAIAPWIAAGKYANLVLHTTPYAGNQCPQQGVGSNGQEGIGNCSMPPWMWTALTESNYITCDGARVPHFRSNIYVTNYQAAVRALVEHYANNPGVGYIRIGLGKGGEINLPKGWHDPEEPCGEAFQRWGYTVGDSGKYTWNAYLEKMLDFEGNLHAAKQLMVSITPVQAPGRNPQEVSDFIAPIAVRNGIGFGNQGLSRTSMRNCTGMQADWCNLFERYQGKVPLELQTLGPSCPQGEGCGGQRQGPWRSRTQGMGQNSGPWGGRWGGSGGGQGRGGQGQGKLGALSSMTGSLVPLLPFAVKNHATILEIYTEDWLIGFNPNNPRNREYGADYAQALKETAGEK
jgi:hypothetical protein